MMKDSGPALGRPALYSPAGRQIVRKAVCPLDVSPEGLQPDPAGPGVGSLKEQGWPPQVTTGRGLTGKLAPDNHIVVEGTVKVVGVR